MNWINNLFYMGLFTALTGSIAFAVYAVVAGVLDGLKKYRYIYGLLLVVLPFWLFPGLFLLLYVTHYRKMGEALFIKGHLFELTPVIAHIECVAAVVWLLGAATVLVLHLVRYYRVEHYIKKHRMPAEKTAAARCGRDKGAFKDPGKCRSVLLLWYFFPDGAGAIS